MGDCHGTKFIISDQRIYTSPRGREGLTTCRRGYLGGMHDILLDNGGKVKCVQEQVIIYSPAPSHDTDQAIPPLRCSIGF